MIFEFVNLKKLEKKVKLENFEFVKFWEVHREVDKFSSFNYFNYKYNHKLNYMWVNFKIKIISISQIRFFWHIQNECIGFVLEMFI